MSVTFNRKGVMRMKKGFFIVLFLLASVFAFADDFCEIQNIKFKTNKEAVIAIMANNGYNVSYPDSNKVSFSKLGETYLNCKVKEYIFVFSTTDNSLISYAIILERNVTVYKDAPKYFKTKYNTEIDDTVVTNPVIDIFKMPFSDGSCIILVDTKLAEYIIRFYNYDVWLD